MTGEGVPYLGSKISLVSRSEIRYEGILYTIDAKDSTLALARVKSFGTEDRPTERPVSARDEIYEYIIFRASDIKELTVCNAPKQGSIGLANDPAIVHHSGLIPQFVNALHPAQFNLYKDGDKSRAQKLDASTQVSNRKGRNQNAKPNRRNTQGERRRNNSYNQKRESNAPAERYEGNKQRQQRPRDPAESNSQRRNSFPRERKGERENGASKPPRPKSFRNNKGAANQSRPTRTVKFDNSFDFEEANAKFMEMELKELQKTSRTEKDSKPKDEAANKKSSKLEEQTVPLADEDKQEADKDNPSDESVQKKQEKDAPSACVETVPIAAERVNPSEQSVEKQSEESVEATIEETNLSKEIPPRVAEKVKGEESNPKEVEKMKSEEHVPKEVEKVNSEEPISKEAEQVESKEPLLKDAEKGQDSSGKGMFDVNNPLAASKEEKKGENKKEIMLPLKKRTEFLPLYDKKKSFYDRISHFSIQNTNPDDWKKEREMNIETFGVPRIQRAYRGRVWVQRGRGQSRMRGMSHGPRNVSRDDIRDHQVNPRGGYRGGRYPMSPHPYYGRTSQPFSPQHYGRPQPSYQYPPRSYRNENNYTRFNAPNRESPRFRRFQQRPDYRLDAMGPPFRSPQPRRFNRPAYSATRSSRPSIQGSRSGLNNARAKTPETPKRFTKANKEAAANQLAMETKSGDAQNPEVAKPALKPKPARLQKEGKRASERTHKKSTPEKKSPRRVTENPESGEAEVKINISKLPEIDLIPPPPPMPNGTKATAINTLPEELKLDTKVSLEEALFLPGIFKTPEEPEILLPDGVDLETIVDKIEGLNLDSFYLDLDDKQTEPKDPEILKDVPNEQREPRTTQITQEET